MSIRRARGCCGAIRRQALPEGGRSRGGELGRGGRRRRGKAATRCERTTPVVLYIDDSENERVLVQLAAELAGVRVAFRCAESMAEGISYLAGNEGSGERWGGRRPVFILLDYHLSGRTGAEFLRWLRVQPQFASLPVCVYSDADVAAVVEHCYAAGADRFLVKPRSFERLQAVVAALGDCAAQPASRLQGLSDLPEHRYGGGQEEKGGI